MFWHAQASSVLAVAPTVAGFPGKPPAGARESPEEVAAILGVVVLGVVVLIVAVLVLDGTETWLLASSAVLFLVCGAGLLANARSRLRREHDA